MTGTLGKATQDQICNRNARAARTDSRESLVQTALAAAKLYDDPSLVDAVVTEPEEARLASLETLTLTPLATSAADIEQLHQAGWSNDAVTLRAMLPFHTSWAEVSGIQDMSGGGYAQSAERLASVGYVSEPAASGR